MKPVVFPFVSLLLAAFVTGCPSSATPGAPAQTASPTPAVEPAVDASAVVVDASIAPTVVDAGDAGPDASTATTAPDDMLLVPGGTFRMGADEGGEGDEHPAHDVAVASFWLDKTEVTQAAYDACVQAQVCTPADPAILATFDGLFRGPQKPVVGISWFSAREYCTWRGKRLPREAEFERAVRGSDGRRFPWGNDAPTKERAVFSANAPEEVGTHPAGRGPYGHDDLTGNVWEWIDDDYDPYAYTRATAAEGRPGDCKEIEAAQNQLRAQGRQGFTGTNPIPNECEKSIRGGAYNYPANGLRSTNRIHHPARFKLRMTGVRCAKDADPNPR